MSKQRKKLSRAQKLRKVFLKTIAITLAVIVVAGGVFAFVYNKYLYTGNGIGSLIKKENDPINKTLAVFGVDEDGYRTDVIFVLNYNSQTKRTRVISIPRDTKVDWSSDMQQRMADIKGYSISTCKINEMTSYVGIDHVAEFTIPEMEEILGIQIDNYVIITLDAFKQIVDAVGGVEVDVPSLGGEGLQYDDRSQDLHIHLAPGLQTLDGEAAEGLVRFRKGYAEGDVGRIKTQQLFLEALFKKVTSPQIVTKVPSLATTVLKTVTTDVKLSDIAGYSSYLKSLGESDLKCNIIPGEPKYVSGKSYFIADEEAMPTFIDEMLNGTPEEQAAAESGEEAVVDKSVSIEVLNSTAVSGLAGKAQTQLQEQGYTVSQIGNYTEDILPQTVIYAKSKKLGKQFQAFYPDAKVIESSKIPYDIQIVLGNDSANK